MLYSLLHDIKRPKNNNRIDQVYFDYLKKSFQFTDAKHDEFLSSARQTTVSDFRLTQLILILFFKIHDDLFLKPPVVSLKLDILQARNLKGKNINDFIWF